MQYANNSKMINDLHNSTHLLDDWIKLTTEVFAVAVTPVSEMTHGSFESLGPDHE